MKVGKVHYLDLDVWGATIRLEATCSALKPLGNASVAQRLDACHADELKDCDPAMVTETEEPRALSGSDVEKVFLPLRGPSSSRGQSAEDPVLPQCLDQRSSSSTGLCF